MSEDEGQGACAAANLSDDERPLAIGLVADNPSFPSDWDHVMAKVRLADQLGFDAVWMGESWGYELFTSLGDLARATTRIKVGAGVASVFSRSAALIAATAATLDERSGGRMLLGLGSSGPQVVEGWHGMPFAKPLQRTREYIDIINTILRREPLYHHGELVTVDRGFRLRFRPVRDHIPIYLAALGPKNIALAGELADGILPIYWPARDYPQLRAALDAGSVAAGRPGGAARIAPYITSAVIGDGAERAPARRLSAGPVAFYVGKMGTFYAGMLAEHGFAEEVAAIQRGWEQGPAAAAAGVSDRMLDETAIVGTPAEVVARLREWRRLGVDEPLLTMPPGTPDEAAPALEALARAAGLR
jgi:F420-dependent oxidoreductase-like protein